MIERRVKGSDGSFLQLAGTTVLDDRNPFLVEEDERLVSTGSEQEQIASLQQAWGPESRRLINTRHRKRPLGIQRLTVAQWARLTRWVDLAGRVDMTPAMKKAAQVEAQLRGMQGPDYVLPSELRELIDSTLDSWVLRGWSSTGQEPEPEDSVARPKGSEAANRTPVTAGAGRLISPTSRHFQPGGIAHGIWLYYTPRRVCRLDKSVTRRADVYGNNGLSNGAWWPSQLASMVPGAHGNSQGGIYAGSSERGAFSIVVSGMYAGMDLDLGDSLSYSASQALDNESRTEALVSRGSRSLDRSIQSGLPVRVLRSAHSGSRYAPSVGIRYDGLYRVTGKEKAYNEKGGLYWRYKVVRNPDQEPIRRNLPNGQQRADYHDFQALH